MNQKGGGVCGWSGLKQASLKHITKVAFPFRYTLMKGCGVGGVTRVIVVRCASQYFETYPIHLCGLWKRDPFMYLIVQNVDLFIICPLIFCTHLLLVVRQILQSVHWIPREQAASKNLWAKNIPICRDVGKKWGLSHTNEEKSGQSYTFSWKRGANHIRGSAEKGGHSARTSVLCHI